MYFRWLVSVAGIAALPIAACSSGSDAPAPSEVEGSKKLQSTADAACSAADPGIATLPRTFADVNADGASDFCRFVGPESSPTLSCMLGSKTDGKFGFQYEFQTSEPIDPGSASLPRTFADMNGDGRADYCRFVASDGGAMSCVLATASGFGASQVFASPTPFDAGDAKFPRTFIDVNGDKKADYCRIVGSGTSTRAACSISTGTGFGDQFAYSSPAGLNAGSDTRPRAFVNINNDGFVDYCRFINTSNGWNPHCSLGTASGMGTTISYMGFASPDEPNVFLSSATGVPGRYCSTTVTSPGKVHARCNRDDGIGLSFPNIPLCCPLGYNHPSCCNPDYTNGDAALPRGFFNVISGTEPTALVDCQNTAVSFPGSCVVWPTIGTWEPTPRAPSAVRMWDPVSISIRASSQT